MEFELEDGQVFVKPNRATLDHWLRTLSPGGPNTFAIMTMANGDYLQTATRDGKFVLECRRQSPPHHCRAIDSAGSDLFEIGEVVDAYVAFGWEHPDTPAFITWKNMDAEVGL